MALKLALIFLNIILLIVLFDGVKKVAAHHFMCEEYRPEGTLTVWAWEGFDKHGITYQDIEEAVDYWPNLSLVAGNWWEADVLITGLGLPFTYVDTVCRDGYVRRGNNSAVVHVGSLDSYRNREWLTHELGHALGYADHLAPHQQRPGHINPGPCLPGHIMSYC